MIVTREPEGYTIEVRDDGVGFDLAAPPDSTGHYGLLGLRERARLLGGSVELKSTPGEGTTLRLLFPPSAGQEGQEHWTGGQPEMVSARGGEAYDG